MLRRLIAFACCLSFAACAIDMPFVPMNDYVNGNLAPVAAAMQKELVDGEVENLALVHNVLGECELMLGNVDSAWRNFEIAGRLMGNWATSGGEEFAAIVGSESSKTYKGDPYEKGMNAFYLGLSFLWRGEADNARAALKRGILADAEVGDERYQADNPLLFWLAGRMSLLMGLSQEAGNFFVEAAEANAFALQHGSRGDDRNAVFGAPDRGNLVLLFACGMGPQKVAGGRFGELARFEPSYHPAHGARVTIDGNDLGTATVVSDVDYQARTRGGTQMAGIRKGKAVFKQSALVAGQTLLHVSAHNRGDKARTAAIVGGALIFLGLLTSTRADTRHWPTLPATIQVLCADIAPGSHTLVIDFLDRSGKALSNLRQEWVIDVPESGESYYLFRSLPGLHRALES